MGVFTVPKGEKIVIELMHGKLLHVEHAQDGSVSVSFDGQGQGAVLIEPRSDRSFVLHVPETDREKQSKIYRELERRKGGDPEKNFKKDSGGDGEFIFLDVGDGGETYKRVTTNKANRK